MAVVLLALRPERPLSQKGEAVLLDLVPPHRRQRLLRMPRPEERREPLCAYALLRLALREARGWERFPEVALSPRGKPFFPEYPAVQFSLSHTRGAVMAGVGDLPLGVDIEQVRPLSPRQLERLGGGTAEEFFPSWVRREARSKRTGQGVAAFLRGEPPMEDGEVYRAVETFPGYAAGIACTRGENLLPVRLPALEELLGGLS